MYVLLQCILLLLYKNNGVLSYFVNATFTDNAIFLQKSFYILVLNCPDIFFIFWLARVADGLTLKRNLWIYLQAKPSENLCYYIQ